MVFQAHSTFWSFSAEFKTVLEKPEVLVPSASVNAVISSKGNAERVSRLSMCFLGLFTCSSSPFCPHLVEQTLHPAESHESQRSLILKAVHSNDHD